MNEIDGQDWVLKRAECSLETMFHNLIGTLRCDIDKFNGLKEHKRGDRLFLIESNGGPDRKIFRAKRNSDGALFKHGSADDHILVLCNKGHIVACRPCRWEIIINVRWNEETASCDFLIDETVRPLWRISQTILVDFLFGNIAR